MAYQVWSVVFGEQPSASKWNILGTNDASFNDGTGIASSAIITAKIADDAVTSAKLDVIQTTDANGWRKIDLGSTIIYRKRITFSQTIAGLAILSVSSTNLPTGVSTLSTRTIEYSFVTTSNAGALQIAFEGSASSSALQFTTATTDTVSRAYTGFIDLVIIEPV